MTIYIARNTAPAATRAFKSLSAARTFGSARFYTSTGNAELLGYSSRADMHADRNGARPDLIATWIDVVDASALHYYLSDASADRVRAVEAL